MTTISRMVGGVLVERTVKEVLPALVGNRWERESFTLNFLTIGFNRDKMGKLIESLDKQLTEKGEEINAYMEKHNIQLRDQQGGKKDEGKGDEKDSKSGGVLVAN